MSTTPKYGFAHGSGPEEFGPAEYDSHRAALLAGIAEQGDCVPGCVVSTCRAEPCEPGRILYRALTRVDIFENAEDYLAENPEETGGLDDAYFKPSAEAVDYFDAKLSELCDDLAARFTIARARYVAKDITEHDVTQADIDEALR